MILFAIVWKQQKFVAEDMKLYFKAQTPNSFMGLGKTSV
jgi:hypothetical protein